MKTGLSCPRFRRFHLDWIFDPPEPDYRKQIGLFRIVPEKEDTEHSELVKL